jgi:hypothetical protein
MTSDQNYRNPIGKGGGGKQTSMQPRLDQEPKMLLLHLPVDLLVRSIAKPGQTWDMNPGRERFPSFLSICSI